jgi:predicted transcriptional regulator of viral defense system
MNHLKKLENLISEQMGTVLSSDLEKYEIPRTYLSLMVSEGTLERVSRGVYTLKDTLEDEMYIMQSKYPKLIFSHETALFLYGLSDRTPYEYSATVPSGTKVVSTISSRFKIYYIKKEFHDLGVEELKTTFGHSIKVTSLERTICDIVRSKSRIDIQIFSEALKRFSKTKTINYYLLNEYSKKFNIEKNMRMYMEVLL